MKKRARRGKKVTYGTGSTRWTVTWYDVNKITPEDFDELFGVEAPTFKKETEQLAAWCRATLKKAGFDPDGGDPKPYPAKLFNRQTDFYYAHYMLKYRQVALDGIERNDADYAARYALRLGRAWREWGMKGRADYGLKRGKKYGKKNNRRRSEDNAERDQKMTDLFVARIGSSSSISASMLKESIGRKYDLGRSRSIDVINGELKRRPRKLDSGC